MMFLSEVKIMFYVNSPGTAEKTTKSWFCTQSLSVSSHYTATLWKEAG